MDWHWDRILAGAALSTLLGIGAELAAPDNSGSSGGVTVAVRQSAQHTVNRVGQEITKRDMSIQPTLTIRPGFPMLDRYAELHARAWSEPVDVPTLIPHMLAAFMERGGGFKALRSKPGRPATSPQPDASPLTAQM